VNNTSERSGIQTTDIIRASLKKRYARERRFQWYGRIAVLIGFVFLFILLGDIFIKGTPAFTQHYINMPINFDPELLGIGPEATPDEIDGADYAAVIKSSLRTMFPDVTSAQEKKQLYRLISLSGEYALRDMVINDPKLIGTTSEIWLQAHSEAGSYLKGQVSADSPEAERRVKDTQVAWLDTLQEEGRTESRFNSTFFLAGDSREPEMAGIRAALYG